MMNTVFWVLWTVMAMSCSPAGEGNLGYSEMSSSGNMNNPNQNAGNAFPNSPQSNQFPGMENSGQNGQLNTDTSTDTSTETQPEIDPKPIGTKVFTGAELLQVFKDNADLIDLSIDENSPPGISDDEETVKKYCAELRYDNHKIVTGGQSYASPDSNKIIKWDATAGSFKVLGAVEAGNSRLYKLECSND